MNTANDQQRNTDQPTDEYGKRSAAKVNADQPTNKYGKRSANTDQPTDEYGKQSAKKHGSANE